MYRRRLSARQRATCAATALFFAVGLTAPDDLCPRHPDGSHDAPVAESVDATHHGQHEHHGGHGEAETAQHHGHHHGGSGHHEDHGGCDCLTLCQIETGETASLTVVANEATLGDIDEVPVVAGTGLAALIRPARLIPYPNPPPFTA